VNQAIFERGLAFLSHEGGHVKPRASFVDDLGEDTPPGRLDWLINFACTELMREGGERQNGL
jgi:hypothetical protein